MTYLWVAIGSALGGMARYWVAGFVTRLAGPVFPWGTLLINMGGSFVIGLFGALTMVGGRLVVPGDLRIFVMVGICGGYTTFSSFSLQTLDLLQAGELAWAAAYILMSVSLCLLFVWLGWLMGRV
jgi:CrcB protein